MIRFGWAVFTVVWASTFAATHPAQASADRACGMFPRNNFVFPDRGNHAVSYAAFTQILGRLQSVYTPLFQSLGTRLVVDGQWYNDRPDAFADTSPDRHVRMIHITGGLARAPGMSGDALLLAACHELGHHLGGAPLFPSADGTIPWASGEGEADYYATLKCMRATLAGLGAPIVPNFPAEPIVRQTCYRAHGQGDDLGVCLRSMTAGRVLATVINQIVPSQANPPRFETPDREQIAATIVDYPVAQCRLDTFAAGALCDADPRALMSLRDPRVASCDDGRPHNFGARPRCWFNPAVAPQPPSPTPPAPQPLPPFPGPPAPPPGFLGIARR